jgi:hypothetical protein
MNSSKDLINLDPFLILIKILKEDKDRKVGKPVLVTDITTGLSITYQSQRRTARSIDADVRSFYNRTKLFQKKYKIELLTKENRTLLIEKKIYFISIEVIKLRVVINNTKV